MKTDESSTRSRRSRRKIWALCSTERSRGWCTQHVTRDGLPEDGQPRPPLAVAAAAGVFDVEVLVAEAKGLNGVAACLAGAV